MRAGPQWGQRCWNFQRRRTVTRGRLSRGGDGSVAWLCAALPPESNGGSGDTRVATPASTVTWLRIRDVKTAGAPAVSQQNDALNVGPAEAAGASSWQCASAATAGWHQAKHSNVAWWPKERASAVEMTKTLNTATS
jgi:hypothetical protein